MQAPPLPATSNDCGVGEGRRRAVVEGWNAARRLQKHERRGANKEWSEEQRAGHERLRRARESTVHVTLEPWGLPLPLALALAPTLTLTPTPTLTLTRCT